MALASSPLIWIKLRLVTGIPRMAYATELAPELTPIELAPAGAMLACEFDLAITEAIVARVE